MASSITRSQSALATSAKRPTRVEVVCWRTRRQRHQSSRAGSCATRVGRTSEPTDRSDRVRNCSSLRTIGSLVQQRLALAGKPVEVGVMKVKRQHYKTHKDLPREEYLTPGSPLCAGCGGLTTLTINAQGVGRKRGGCQRGGLHDTDGGVSLHAAQVLVACTRRWVAPLRVHKGIRDALDVLAAKGELAARGRSEGVGA